MRILLHFLQSDSILTVIPYMDGQFNFFQDIEIIVFIIVHIQSM